MVDDTTLAAVAASALGAGVAFERWTSNPIEHRRISRITGPIDRYEFVGRDRAGSVVRAGVIRKSLHRFGADLAAGPDRSDPSENPEHWNYWRREYDAYGSDILATLPRELLAPRCYLREAGDHDAVLWLEEIEERPAAQWSDTEFFRAGLAIGRWQSDGIREPSLLPHDVWLCRSFLRAWSFGEADQLAISRDPNLWSQPIAREHFSPRCFAEACRLAAEHASLLASAERSPAVIAHNDLWSSNLFAGRAAIVAIDWAMLGLSSFAEDVANLVYDSVWMFEIAAERLPAIEEAVFTGYAAGLDAGDAGVTHAALAVAFRRIAALRFGTLAAGLLRSACDSAKMRMLAQRYTRPYEEVFATRAAVIRRALRQLPE